MLGGCAASLLTTRALARTQLVLLQDNDGHDNFGNRAQTKSVKVHNLQVAEGTPHRKDDNAYDTSCGIRLPTMRTTLVKAQEVLSVRKSHRERTLNLITFQASRNALFMVQEHLRLPNRLNLTVSRHRLPMPTLQNTVEMDAAQREAESLG
ncbi:hypothetical protein K443DRAFT_8392 [Laccaria amethystina LaAM-08-1]|uniref:Uncharacterized protein n=1 Tax=Laccaria amethystina LaAM-08-1 TaxID=1095629 RepID=A0A0C9XU33_9AGAR|nr:hypothetical protein K443DRAFT_8392 [Laccaria amethystina LaAM-08-1]